MDAGCEWIEDEEGNWSTECRRLFCLNEGTPKENGMNFCCYCGGALTEGKYEEQGE
jgi:hypothetical protein